MQCKMVCPGIAGVAAILFAVAPPVMGTQAPSEPIVVQSGLRSPESALHDVAADVYLVSNISGNPSEKNGRGFITRVAPDGQVAQLKWIDGEQEGVTLHAPKGMALRGETLLVADIDAIRLFDRASGKPMGVWPVEGATFMNAIAVGADGIVYATDTGIDLTTGEPKPTGTAAIYRFDQAGKPTVVARGQELQGPNGILVVADGLTVVEFLSNRVLRVAPDGTVSTRFTLPDGGLDGAVRLADGSLLISSWGANAVYQVDPQGKATAIVKDVPAAADLGVDITRGRLLIPQLTEDTLRIVPLPQAR
ncbi:MAG: SMP-30/gluconolactonase/LRE family protein [Acidobacteria bacterium]|nr:SMP-30/gluconolactonase/LRE family protein [Acidobacteriota bacterium]MBA3885382.1 SMP-30/gluconolactonase/LRE family protein [Acidobacteriota bacterium]